jgi:hypothetical protein
MFTSKHRDLVLDRRLFGSLTKSVPVPGNRVGTVMRNLPYALSRYLAASRARAFGIGNPFAPISPSPSAQPQERSTKADPIGGSDQIYLSMFELAQRSSFLFR